jgi:hypothetical protein
MRATDAATAHLFERQREPAALGAEPEEPDASWFLTAPMSGALSVMLMFALHQAIVKQLLADEIQALASSFVLSGVARP